MAEFQKFTISQVAVFIRDDKCLILEDARHPGQYVLPGGRMDEGEFPEGAFRREINEEIGLKDFKVFGLVGFDSWYTANGTAQAGVAYLIGNDKDKIVLSDEHIKPAWVRDEELDNYLFVWPNCKGMIIGGFKLYRRIKK